MEAEPTKPQAAKDRKRPTAKSETRQAAKKQKVSLHLTAEASRRLSVHAAMVGMDRSELVESLIGTHLRRFVVSDRSRGEGEGSDAA